MKGYIIGKFDSKKVKWNFYSDLFDTYEDASKKANELGSTQYDIFESVRHEEPHLESMVLSDYKHGLILTTHKNDKRWGMPYLFGKQFDGGWWNSNANGWFFRSSSFDDLISWGAKYSETHSSDTDNLETDDSLEGMSLTPYGKGFLLTCHKDDPDYGIEYLYGKTADSGWWMPQRNGWFFKSSWLDYLLECGAVMTDQDRARCGAPLNSRTKKTTTSKNNSRSTKFDDFESNEVDTEPDEVNLVGMTLKPYGKGFLLTSPKSYENWGIAYLYGKSADSGWWMPSSGGWFFKSSWLDYLLAHGAVMADNSKDKKTKTKSSKSVELETTSDFLEGMTIKYFGKGLILTCKTNHPSYRVPYLFGKTFDGGWWKESNKGWFFKTCHLDYLVDLGAKLIDTNKSVSFNDDDLSSMEVVKYKNSYLLLAKESDPRYGKKYLFGQDYGSGWWNENLHGWIFRKSFKDDLIDRGVVFN